ncbi:MAG: hypothetical protein ABIN01_10670 [Ferruginibacter sp.]
MEPCTMNKPPFGEGDIDVGDEILFDNPGTVEHNLFWKVVNKISNSRLIVEIREMGFAQKIMVETRDVILLQKNGITVEQFGV